MRDGSAFEQDVRATLESRALLERNPNLLYWYKRLYERIFVDELNLHEKVILEIGSGASPLKRTFPSAVTSDVMPLDYLDHVFDCQEIDRYPGIADESVDIVTLTNVLHHLRDPLAFLKNVRVKLRAGGKVIMVEPYFSALSYPIYKLLHHEPVDFGIQAPFLKDIQGPLSTSNQAIPHMIFFSRPAWFGELRESYDLAATRLEFCTSLSYMMTGGISHRLPIPRRFYEMIYPIDRWLADKAPRLFASFFIAKLVALDA
jgi:SAM-dependent methyltransferase